MLMQVGGIVFCWNFVRLIFYIFVTDWEGTHFLLKNFLILTPPNIHTFKNNISRIEGNLMIIC